MDVVGDRLSELEGAARPQNVRRNELLQGWGHICPEDHVWHEARWEDACSRCGRRVDFKDERRLHQARVIFRPVWMHECSAGGGWRPPAGVACRACNGYDTGTAPFWEHDCTALGVSRRFLLEERCPSCGVDRTGAGGVEWVLQGDAELLALIAVDRAQRSELLSAEAWCRAYASAGSQKEAVVAVSEMERLTTHEGLVQGWGHICPADGLWHEANPWVNEGLCPGCSGKGDYRAANPVGRAYVIYRQIWAHRCNEGTRRLPVGIACRLCAGHGVDGPRVWEHDCSAVMSRRRLPAMDSCPSCGVDALGDGTLLRVWKDDARIMEVLIEQRNAERKAMGMPVFPTDSEARTTHLERYGDAMMAAVAVANVIMRGKMIKEESVGKGEEIVAEMHKTQMLGRLKQDGIDAALRTAGNQFVKGTREPLVALLQRHLAPDDEAMRGRIAAFLDTEFGGAIVASLLSLGLSAMPQEILGGAPAIMARELRVRALSEVGDAVADVLMGPLRETAALYLKGVSVSARDEPALNEPVESSGIRVSVAPEPVPFVQPEVPESAPRAVGRRGR